MACFGRCASVLKMPGQLRLVLVLAGGLGAGCMRRELAGSGSLGSERMCRWWWGPELLKMVVAGRGRALVIVPLIAYQSR